MLLMQRLGNVVTVGLLFSILTLDFVGCRMNESDANAKNAIPATPPMPSRGRGSAARGAGTEVAQLGASRAPPRIAIGGGLLTHLQASGQVSFQLAERKQVRTQPLKEPRGIAALPDGRFLVLSEQVPGRYVVQVVSPLGGSQTYPLLLPLSPLRDQLFHILPDLQAPDEFVVIGDRGAIGYKLELLGENLRRKYSHDLTPQEASTATLTPDGVLWFYKAPGLGKLVRGADAPVVVPMPQLLEPIWHLSPGPTHQSLWASIGAHRIVRLAFKDNTAVIEQTQQEAPWVVHTLASASGQVAALLFAESAGTPTRAVVVAFDARGSQLLRQEVPGPFDPRETWSIALSPSGYCAVASATRLRVFELKSHKLILRHGEALPHID